MTTTTRQNIPCTATGIPLLGTIPINTSAAASLSLTADDSGGTFITSGNTVLQNITLPAAAAGLNFTFINVDSNGVNIATTGGDGICIKGDSVVSVETTALYSTITLLAIDSTNWIVTKIVGAWTLTSGIVLGYLSDTSTGVAATGTADINSGFGSVTVNDGIVSVLNECFTGDTPVLVGENQFKPISTLFQGDEVMSIDPFGRPKLEKVTSIIQSTAKLILTINGTLRCTPSHPFFTAAGWVQAGNLNTSHVLVTRDGEEIPVTHVHRSDHPEGITIYNLHLPLLSSKVFFVGSQAILVHNK